MQQDIHPYGADCALLIIYPYDEVFIRSYERLLDDLADTFNKHHYNGDMVPDHYFDLVGIIELIFDRLLPLNKKTNIEETQMDNIYDDFETELADDIIEVLANYLNLRMFPFGLDQIADTIPENLYLLEVVFDKECDAIYYCFEDSNA